MKRPSWDARGDSSYLRLSIPESIVSFQRFGALAPTKRASQCHSTEEAQLLHAGVFADLRGLADPRCPWNNQVAVQGPILLCRGKMVQSISQVPNNWK